MSQSKQKSRAMRIHVLLGLLCLAVVCVPLFHAHAGFGAKTMRHHMPKREVGRTLNMPKGWLEFGLGYEAKLGRGQWNNLGGSSTQSRGVTKWDTARFTYHTQYLNIRYGLSRTSELWASIKLNQAHLSNSALGTSTTSFSFGEPLFGYRLALYTNKPPLASTMPVTSVVLETWMKFPAANESPGTYIGGPLNFSKFVFGTGTTDLYLGVAAKRQVGPFAFSGHVGYEYRFSGVVQYVIELDNNSFSGRIKPGDRFRADLEVLAQIGPVALIARPELIVRQKTRLGTSSKWVFFNDRLQAVEGSGGVELDLYAEAMVQATRGVDIRLYASMPLVGEDLQFFPLEDIHPTWGPTFGGAVEVRY